MSNQKNNGSIIAIITMMFLFLCHDWFCNQFIGSTCRCRHEERPGGGWFSNMLAMLGNFMNFFAYLFMGIPAGKDAYQNRHTRRLPCWESS